MKLATELLQEHLGRLRSTLASSNLYSYRGRISQIVGMTIEATGIECNVGDVCDLSLIHI